MYQNTSTISQNTSPPCANIGQAYYAGAALLKHLTSTPYLESRLLLQNVLAFSQTDFYLHQQRLLSIQEKKCFFTLLSRRLKGEPIAYILKEKEFWSLPFFVSPEVLIPRPDSEILIEALQHRYQKRPPPKKIIDLGTGSGCLICVLLTLYPQACGIAIDIEEKSLQIAKKNAKTHGLENRIQFLCGNWLDSLQADCCDLIVSNPPYLHVRESIDSEIAHEPAKALFAKNKGLRHYEDIIPSLSRALTHHGVFALEIGASQREAVCTLLRKNPELSSVQIHQDYGQRDRVITGTYQSTHAFT